MSKVRAKKETLSAYMKRARQEAGLSQYEVSKKLGFGSSQFVSNWERGIAGPPTKSIIRLKKLYKLDMNYVVDLLVENTRIKLNRAFGLR
jgi:transcriptional regulator with XRE-family HTH domain